MFEGLKSRNVIGVILGGGQGSRLYPLTQYRSKPAVPIGGKYRLIDIPISNCLHSGINRISVLTQFNSASLHRHISQTFRFDAFSDGFVEILAAEQTQESSNWYQGTADAVRQQLRSILAKPVDQCLILSGDHLYRMNYREFLTSHWERTADVTIAVQPVTRAQAAELGIVKLDKNRRIVGFHEKPQTDAELDALRLEQPVSDDPEKCFLASMGIYIFDPQVMISLLMGNDKEDFGKHIIPDAIAKVDVYAHFFDGYWEDIGTIRAFYETNLALTDADPPFTFDHVDTPIYTHMRNLGGAHLENCRVQRSIIAEGAYLEKAEIVRSVIGVRSRISRGGRIVNTVMMGADYYERLTDLERNAAQGIPDIGIGPRTEINGAIVDKNARIGADVVIRNDARIQNVEETNYHIRDGIVVIPKDAVIPDKMVI